MEDATAEEGEGSAVAVDGSWMAGVCEDAGG